MQLKPVLFRQYIDDGFTIFRSADPVLLFRSPFRTILTDNIELSCFLAS